MNGWNNPELIWPLVISNIVALIILFFCWMLPRIGRLLFLALFIWAGCINWFMATHDPKVYTDYADYTFLPFYKTFIHGWFSQHILLMVGFIATGQLLIGISMLFKGTLFKSGVLGGMIFLIGIIPLGVGSGFPFPILTAFAFYFLYRGSSATRYLWQAKQGVDNLKWT